MGRAVVTERDVRQWRTHYQPEPIESDRSAGTPERHCLNCGHELSPEDVVCRNCGKPVRLTARAPTPEADVPASPLSPPTQQVGRGRRSLPGSAPPPTPDDYTDRLLKYIPAESVALYLTLQGIILSGAGE